MSYALGFAIPRASRAGVVAARMEGHLCLTSFPKSKQALSWAGSGSACCREPNMHFTDEVRRELDFVTMYTWFIVFAPGIYRIVDVVCWVGLVALAQGVMRLVAGPANGDPLARQSKSRALGAANTVIIRRKPSERSSHA